MNSNNLFSLIRSENKMDPTNSPTAKKRITRGAAPYGYKIANGEISIDKKQADVVKLIFKMYLDGHKHKEIIEYLKAKEIMSNRNKNFGQTTIHSMLRNEVYIGTITKIIDGHIHKFKDAIPAIISLSDFELTRSLIGSIDNPQIYKATEPYILSGLAYCAECGGSLMGNRRKSKSGNIWSGYLCSNRKRFKTCAAKEIKKEDVEAEVLRIIENEVFTDDNIKSMTATIYEAYVEEIKLLNDKIKTVNLKLNGTKEQINNIVTSISKGTSSPSLERKLTELELDLSSLKKELKMAKHQKANPITKDEITKFLLDNRRISVMSVENQIKIINIFIEKVVISKDEVNVYVIY